MFRHSDVITTAALFCAVSLSPAVVQAQQGEPAGSAAENEKGGDAAADRRADASTRLPDPDDLGASAEAPKEVSTAPAKADDGNGSAPPAAAEQGKNWRVAPPKDAPYQVRRAVGRVLETATSVADTVAGGPGSVDEPTENKAASEGDETEPAEKATAKLRRIPRKKRDESNTEPQSTEPAETERLEPPSSDGLFEAARRLLRRPSDSGLQLGAYVDDPRWEKAMELLVEDDCREALDLVDSVLDESDRDLKSDVPGVRYAVARIKLCAGQPAEGRATLRKLAKRDDAVGEIARRRLGHSPSTIRSDSKAPQSVADFIRLAHRKAAGGDLDEALETLGEVTDSIERTWHRYKVKMAEAEILLRGGRVSDAARTLLGVYEMTRDWRIGDRVTARIERIEKRNGVEILPFGARVDRMRELIARGRYSKARRVSVQNAKIAGVRGDEIRGWSYYRKALQAEREKRRRKAVELFEDAERLVESSVMRPRIYFGWARALRRLDRDDEAIKLYERLCSEYPRNHLCDDSRYEAGRLLQYGNHHDKAREKFADVVGLHPESDHVPDALWRGAFSAYLMGDYQEAERPLKLLMRHHPDEEDSSGLPASLKARYWLGVCAFKQGEIERAERIFQETINQGALTWYGRLAAKRMQRVGTQPVVPLPPVTLSNRELKDLGSLEIPKDERLQVVAEYARLGLYGDAIEELKRQISVEPAPEKSDRLLASLRLINGDPAKAHWMMKKHIGLSAPTIYDLRDWGIAYPVDYLEHGHKYGARYDVSPYLVQSIMRQESAFRPEVASWVGAVGLMQLMPGTANTVSDDFLDGAYYSRRKLQQPESNIKLGTVYVRALLSYVDGRIPMALAGYNAGPAPLDSWFERYGDREIDAWVESITYQQARGYVRKVYTNYIRYSALYDGRLPPLELELPETFNDWGDDPILERSEKGEAVSEF